MFSTMDRVNDDTSTPPLDVSIHPYNYPGAPGCLPCFDSDVESWAYLMSNMLRG